IDTFGDATVEVKANWLKRPTERKRRYLDHFGISDETLTKFSDSLYDVMLDHHLELVACVVNKRETQESYEQNCWYAPAIAYECVVQRVQRAMEAVDGWAHITIDDMTGKSPKGREWRIN